MDIYVPNDTVRAKPDWAALTMWAPGEMPKGISGLPMEDNLMLAFVVGRRRAAIMPLGSTLALVFGNCTVTGRGGTKSVVARREGTWPVIDLAWSVTLSSGHVLALTAQGVLMSAKRGEPLNKVNLESLGFTPESNPPVSITLATSVGVDEAYLAGEIGSPTGVMKMYRLKANAITAVSLPHPMEGYTMFTRHIYTWFGGSMILKSYDSMNAIEHIGFVGGTAKILKFSPERLDLGFRMFEPTVIGHGKALYIRYSVEHTGPPSTNLHSILAVTDGDTSTDIASTSIQGVTNLAAPSIFALGNDIAITVMPRLWPEGYIATGPYNVGFFYSGLGSFWVVDPPNTSTIYYRSKEIMVTDGVKVMPLFYGVRYNNEVNVIPLGAGKGLIFLVMPNVPGSNFDGWHPEVHYFDGEFVHRVTADTLWPDVDGMCLGEGEAVFVTGNIEVNAQAIWYRFSQGSLSTIGDDPSWQSDHIAMPMQFKGYLMNGIGAIPRYYLGTNGSVVASHVWVFGAPEGTLALELKRSTDWQVPCALTALSGAAVITTYTKNGDDPPTEFSYFYLCVKDTTTLTHIGDITNTTTGAIPPAVIRVGAGRALLQLDSGVVSVMSNADGTPAVSPFTPPNGWAGELVPIGEEFMMFSPSTVRDLRPGILASSGQI